MIIYHAGNLAGLMHFEHALYDGAELPDMSSDAVKEHYQDAQPAPRLVASRLITYADFELMDLTASVEFWSSRGRLFIDCGAYSVHMRGAEINIADYMEFVRRHHAEAYVQLDVVGDPSATRRNREIMEAEGLKPLPVYTAAAPLRDLEELCERYDYIALGGLRGREQGTDGWRIRTLDAIFRVAARHWPVRFHAFGITAQPVLERYPLYSADSSNAIIGSRLGFMTCFDRGQLSYGPWREHARLRGDGIVVDGIGAPKSAYFGRVWRSAQAMVQAESYVTKLWAARGITWEKEPVAS